MGGWGGGGGEQSPVSATVTGAKPNATMSPPEFAHYRWATVGVICFIPKQKEKKINLVIVRGKVKRPSRSVHK